MTSSSLPYSYKSVQTLRGVAALLVALMHLIFFYCDSMVYIGGPAPHMATFLYFKGFGGVGMQIFFVISGFIMAYLNAIGETKTFGAFMAKRFTRIVPLYWLCTIVYAFLLVNPSAFGFWRIAQSLFFIPRHDNSAVLGPGWSLNFEMMFYALFALVTLVARASFLWVGIVFLAMQALGKITGFYVFNLYSDPIVWDFVAGIAIFHIHRMEWVKRESLWIFLAGTVILLSSIYWHIPDLSYGPRQFIPWGVPSMMIVLGAVSMEVGQKHAWIFKSRTLLALGNASYALYLIHAMCFVGVSKLLLYTLAVQKYIGPDGAVLLYLVVCCVIALAVHHLVEKPMNKMVRLATGAITSRLRAAHT